MRIVHRVIAITLAVLSLVGGAVAASPETVIYSFTGGTDGGYPFAGLIADNQGALYGATLQGGGGGNGNCSSVGCGIVFKLTPPAKGQSNWKETVLYTFCSLSGCSDGSFPQANLIADKEGALYGTTVSGGNGCPLTTSGCGTVFKLTPPAKGQTAWTETVLYSFGGSDGAYPHSSLIADKEGALYGTTQGGGTGIIVNEGTVFKLTPPAKGQTAWTETVLYSFCSLSNCSDGAQPNGLIFDKDGALYGSASLGGSITCGTGSGCGTVFKLIPPAKGQSNWKEAVLYSFAGGSNGAFPLAALIFDDEGALVSTTVSGGVGCASGQVAGCGTVFKLTPPAKGQSNWKETVLYTFCSLPGCSDGAGPAAGLIADRRGVLFGTAQSGGIGCPQNSGCGIVFKLTPPAKGQTAWKETALYRFSGTDGANPYAGLIADKQNSLFGTTLRGGGGCTPFSYSCGTVFELTLCPEPRNCAQNLFASQREEQ